MAPTLKPVHIIRYPETKAAVGAIGVPWRSDLRTIPAYSKIMGDALGSIIPTIMIAHIRNMNIPSMIVQGWICMTFLVMPFSIPDIVAAK